MTKHITVKLTEDQLKYLIIGLEMDAQDKEIVDMGFHVRLAVKLKRLLAKAKQS